LRLDLTRNAQINALPVTCRSHAIERGGVETGLLPAIAV
jgi:hypothetical protein